MYTPKGRKYIEVIAPNAFDQTDFTDLVCAFDHGDFLAAPPTLKFGIDQKGLWYSYDHDEKDPSHVTMLRRIERGDCKGSSFKFLKPENEDQVVTVEGDTYLRTLIRIRKTLDVSPVIRPAYASSTVFARSLDALPAVDEIDNTPVIETPVAEVASVEELPAESRALEGAYDTDIDPTPAQKEAGNYRKGRVTVAGMDIAIENPKGATRSGVDPEGVKWSITMKAHYGYILGSKAGDGDNLDVFLTDSAADAKFVFVVDQIRKDGSFDEHKVIIGPQNQDEARSLYLKHYQDGWPGLGAISFVPMACFRAWAYDGKVKRFPLMYEPPKNIGGVIEVDFPGSEERAADPSVPAAAQAADPAIPVTGVVEVVQVEQVEEVIIMRKNAVRQFMATRLYN